MEIPEAYLVILCSKIGIGKVASTAAVNLAVSNEQARDSPLLLRRQCLIESAASHDGGKLGFRQVGVSQIPHKMQIS